MTLVTLSPANPGDELTDDLINSQPEAIAAVVNGNIDDTNISSVSGSKIAGSTVTSVQVAPGAVVQVVDAPFTSVATGTTTIPLDNTIPQNTEGDQYMTLAITPKSATNKLVITTTVYAASSAAAYHMIAALFQDSTANALAASAAASTGNNAVTITFTHTMVAGTTSATTFKVRAGGDAAGTTTFNGRASAVNFGAITKSSMVITEYKV